MPILSTYQQPAPTWPPLLLRLRWIQSVPFSLSDTSKVHVTWPIDYFDYSKTGPTPAKAASFFVARDTAAIMQAALDAGKHLLITPGIY